MRNCRNCPDAVARITGGVEAPRLSGCVQFYQENGCVLIVARISGLPRESETGFFRVSHPSRRELLRNGFFWHRKPL